MSIKTRIEKLESRSTAGTVAGALGGMAVVTRLPNGRYRLSDKREFTQAELDVLLRGCTGKLLILSNWR